MYSEWIGRRVARIPKESGNLPADTTSFVGRRNEVARSRQLLGQTRLLTLTGPGGMGKSRLAVRVAAQVRRSFPDGAWLVDLAAVEKKDLLVHAVLSALEPGRDMGQHPLATLTGYLDGKRLLLLLDNCEHLLEGCASLVHALLAAVPGLQVITTSRQALGVAGEYLLTVPPLSAPDPDTCEQAATAEPSEALRLFADRAAAALGEHAPSKFGRAAALICHRVDGIPLAIELAAARMRVLTSEQILHRLNDRFALLAGGSRAALPRQQTMRATVDWSFDLCGPREQLLWARLSVFPGSFDLEAVERVCTGEGLAPEEALDAVTGLVDKSVLTREGDHLCARYRMLETLRQYGRAKLCERGEAGQLRRRHRDHYRSLVLLAEAEWFTGRQTLWFARLHQERPNLRAALDFCLSDTREARAGLEMAGALWSHRLGAGSLDEERHWLARTLASDSMPSPARVKALWADGWMALLRGDTTSAHDRLTESSMLTEELSDLLLNAHVEQFDGLIALFRDDFVRAMTLFESALQQYRTHGDLGDTWSTLFLLSLSCCLAADSRAAVLCDESLALCESHDAQWSRAFALWISGLRLWLAGDVEQAVGALREGLGVASATDNRLALAQCLEVLAWARAGQGHHAEGAELLGAAQSTWNQVGATLPGVGRLLRHHTECETLLGEALGQARFIAGVRTGAAFTTEQAVARGLSRQIPSPGAAPAPDSALTPREVAVAQLVAQGLADKQIAARLVISPRTAQGHVQRTLAKLGFTSRTQIAIWVQEQTTGS
ncbi:LuxR C-terminal-related transcriptional regulator [Streptomyces virginiae]|uniref:ATP-binding protein n=1 Tax=Streptomyces virginiae TaxID=1961 RepID=UPI002254F354|nr:LuxR C-terminal-related transcriptional regulator [Streptomyces virginiae]MCX4721859.1 LuxR C-terminal-related transcriptional regulator [Streptomyces virginiae]